MNKPETLYFAFGKCSLGLVLVAVSKIGICAVELGDNEKHLSDELKSIFPKSDLLEDKGKVGKNLKLVIDVIENPDKPINIKLDERGTPFQLKVWKYLRSIKPGTTRSYSEIAEIFGMPKGARAVGTACGSNPISILTPCHRVISKDGKLTGFRWGKDRKAILLERERVLKIRD